MPPLPRDYDQAPAEKTGEVMWYYYKESRQFGPVSKGDIAERILNGKVFPTTLVWSAGMEDWIPAQSVSSLAGLFQAIPPPPPTALMKSPQRVESMIYEGVIRSARPWVRYWARLFDLYVFSLICCFVLVIIAPQFIETANETLVTMILCFLWIFVEALLLSSFQTTPGKWLFKTNLKVTSGAQIDFSQALTRSLKVWWRGLGTGFPIASLITHIIAYNNLNRVGITSWDRELGFTVVHEKIGVRRVLVAITLLAAITFSIVILIFIVA